MSFGGKSLLSASRPASSVPNFTARGASSVPHFESRQGGEPPPAPTVNYMPTPNLGAIATAQMQQNQQSPLANIYAMYRGR